MSNLKNMTNKILEDAKAEVSKIEKSSQKANQEILNSRISEANKIKEKVIEDAKEEAEVLKKRLQTEVDLKVRDEKILAKRQVLNKAFETAKDRLKNIDGDRYLSYLKNSLNNINLKGTELLIVPEKFNSLVRESLDNVNVSQNESVESGFIIKDGNIIINHSFESLIDFMKEDLEVEIAKILFEEKG